MLQESLTQVLTRPSAAALWHMRSVLLQSGMTTDEPVYRVLSRFHTFLLELEAGLRARHFSHIATLLDIGAIGGVAVQNLLESNQPPAQLWRRLLAGGISEGLMVMASRQYVRGADVEVGRIINNAAWYLYEALWQLSIQFQPDLEADRRCQILDDLFGPILDERVNSTARAVLTGRLFQVLLLLRMKERRDHPA